MPPLPRPRSPFDPGAAPPAGRPLGFLGGLLGGLLGALVCGLLGGLLCGLPGCTDPGVPVTKDGSVVTPPAIDSALPWPGPDRPVMPRDSGPAAPPPIVVVVLADDLGDNFLWAMPNVAGRLEPESVYFTRTYVTVPLCCPVRASFLSGGNEPRLTGVHANDLPNGGVTLFHDGTTLATRMQEAGFATAILGKYLNGYEDVAPYVPPGWDLFLVPSDLGDSYDSTLVRGSTPPDAPGEGIPETTGGAYVTRYLFEQALAFIDAHADEPTFVLLTPQSPHIFGTPATEDLGTWAGYQPRPPGFGEEDVSDKPAWLQAHPVPSPMQVAAFDAETERMMENLASLDRAVGDLLDGLDARGLLDRTVLVFTSDNGHLHGEHRLTAKGVGYEESVHVPLLVRAAGVAPREDARLVAMNLDLPATIAAVAGLPAPGEGESLLPALADPTAPARDHVFLETSEGDHPVWAGVVTDRWKYVEWGTGETELYDRDADPYELASEHAAPPADADVAAFSAWVAADRALAITTYTVPTGAVGVPYDVTLTSWGGTPPFTWTLDTGALPTGLALDPDGRVHGTPTRVESRPARVRVTDSAVSPLTGEPATFALDLTFAVGSAVRATAAWEGGTARFFVPARPGTHVRVGATLDDTRDIPPFWSGERVAGKDGRVYLDLPGLDPGRDWHWQATVDGVAAGRGVLRRISAAQPTR